MADLHTLAHYRAGAGSLCEHTVAETLRALGGAAHRDLIVAVLCGSSAYASPKAVLASDVDRILTARGGPDRPFIRVFGADSRRWALNPAARIAKPSAPRRRLSQHRFSPAPAVEPA